MMLRLRIQTALTAILLGIPLRILAQPVEVPLIQPLDDSSPSIQSNDLLIITYFESFAPYFYIVAVGFCTLWIVLGGIQIMISGSDSSKVSEGKGMIIQALTALLILTFGGFVLRLLNDTFFVT